jgi:hypothetical protein
MYLHYALKKFFKDKLDMNTTSDKASFRTFKSGSEGVEMSSSTFMVFVDELLELYKEILKLSSNLFEIKILVKNALFLGEKEKSNKIESYRQDQRNQRNQKYQENQQNQGNQLNQGNQGNQEKQIMKKISRKSYYLNSNNSQVKEEEKKEETNVYQRKRSNTLNSYQRKKINIFDNVNTNLDDNIINVTNTVDSSKDWKVGKKNKPQENNIKKNIFEQKKVMKVERTDDNMDAFN